MKYIKHSPITFTHLILQNKIYLSRQRSHAEPKM